MASSMFDQWSPSHKISFAPIMELNEITTRLCGELFRQNIKAINQLAQSGQEQMQEFAQVKGLDSAIQAQSHLLAKTTPQVLKHAEEVLETVLGAATEYQTWLEHNLETMKQQGKVVADKISDKVKN